MHDEYGVGLIQHGAQRSRSGRGMVEAGAGDIITCNPGEVHDGQPIGDAGRAWTMLYLDPLLVEATTEDVCEGKGGRYEFDLPRLRSDRLTAAFLRLFASLTQRQNGASMCSDEELLKLMSELIRVRPGRPQAVPPTIARARARIDDAPASAVSLAELAAEARMSRFQLLRAFERATGLTPRAYLIQRRLRKAREMIARGTPLAETAAAAGFADQSHMTRLFVRTYGVSPGGYARSIR